MKQPLTHNQIRQLCAQAALGTIDSIRKIEIGFSNDVYCIDDKYILKTGRCDEDEEPFRKDVFLCNLLQDKVPAPKIIYSDTSKTLVDRFFMIYHKIPGSNLYSKWHLLSRNERREVTRQLCAILRQINETPYDSFAREFHIDTCQSWHDMTRSRINGWLDKINERNLLPSELVTSTIRFLDQRGHVLHNEKIALTYWDPHFDNILISDSNHITGVLDFERTDIMSIDYVLDIVQRMVRYPGKYASEESEPFTKIEDYSELLDWYEEFYPELFDFEDLGTRLDIYSIEHSLGDIFYFPASTAAREELYRCISLK